MTEAAARHAVRLTIDGETVDGLAVSGCQVVVRTSARAKER
jgi:hypothetical protein